MYVCAASSRGWREVSSVFYSLIDIFVRFRSHYDRKASRRVTQHRGCRSEFRACRPFCPSFRSGCTVSGVGVRGRQAFRQRGKGGDRLAISVLKSWSNPTIGTKIAYYTMQSLPAYRMQWTCHAGPQQPDNLTVSGKSLPVTHWTILDSGILGFWGLDNKGKAQQDMQN